MDDWVRTSINTNGTMSGRLSKANQIPNYSYPKCTRPCLWYSHVSSNNGVSDEHGGRVIITYLRTVEITVFNYTSPGGLRSGGRNERGRRREFS